MLRPVAISLVLALTFPGNAAALDAFPHWKGAGWYRMTERDMPDEYWIDGGPFPSEQVCKATLPVKKSLQRSRCEYLATQPIWDLN